jgi:hypothetical protein
MRLVGISIGADVSAAILHWFTTSYEVRRGFILEIARQTLSTSSFSRIGDEDMILTAFH